MGRQICSRRAAAGCAQKYAIFHTLRSKGNALEKRESDVVRSACEERQ